MQLPRLALVPAALALALGSGCGKRHESSPEATPDKGEQAGKATDPAAATAAAADDKPATPPPPLPADAGEHTGTHLWSTRMGGVLADAGRSIAVDGKGNTLAAGYLRGPVDLGGGQTLPCDDADAFVAKFGADGALLWARNLGGKGEDGAEAVTADKDGNAIVAGAFSYEIAMPDGKLTSKGADDAFIAKFDGDGRRLWVKRFGGPDVDAIYGIDTDKDGNIYATGEIAMDATMGDIKLISEGAADIFVMKLDPGGEVLWAKRFGAIGADYGRSVRVGADGHVVLLGEFSREVDFGTGQLVSAGNRDIVVVQLDADGKTLWAKRMGGEFDELAVALAVDPVGSAILTGSFDGKATIAGKELTSAGLADVFVAKLGPDGSPQWVRQWGGKEADIGAGVAADGAGNIIATGWFWYTIDAGKGTLTSAGKKDAYVVALAPDGQTLWSQRFGGRENDFLQGVAVDADGNPVVTGTFHRKVSFGGSELAASADPKAEIPLGDVVVAKLAR